MIDIVIPVYNEEKLLRLKADYYAKLKDKARIIFVDGGSADQTLDLAQQYGEVVKSHRSRAQQKNMGQGHCRSNKILFLHVDSFVDLDAIGRIDYALNNGICAGCFTMKIDDRRLIFRVFEKIINFRARVFGIMDGDLGLFVKREIFKRIGQFDDVPVMEDILFSKKMRLLEKTVVLPETILVSSRKWYENGFLKTFGLYCLAYLHLWTNIPFFKKGKK